MHRHKKQTYTPHHRYKNADLHGKDVDRFVKEVSGPGWTSGINHANGDSEPYHYNHYNGDLVFESREKLTKDGRPEEQDREERENAGPVTGDIQKATGDRDNVYETQQSIKSVRAPIGRVWKKGIDLKSGEVYWENLANGEMSVCVCVCVCMFVCLFGEFGEW